MSQQETTVAAGDRREERNGALARGRSGASAAGDGFLRLLYRSACLANAAESVETAAANIIDAICRETGWSAGRLYLRLPGGQLPGGHWLIVTDGSQLPAGWVRGEELTPRAPAEDDPATAAILGVHGVRAERQGVEYCGVPLVDAGEAVGALVFARRQHSDGHAGFQQALVEVAGHLVQVARRVHAQRSALRQQQDLAQIGRLSSMRELARNLAHEVNQPLAAVVSYAGGALQLLEQKRADEQKMRRALEQVGVQAKRASGIIQEFREFLRREDTRHDRIDIAGLVRAAVSLVQAGARDAGITIRLQLPPSLPPVVGDTVQLQQVLINLMENAIEAMSSGQVENRELSVSAEVAEQLEICVRDTGGGMREDLLPQLFTPFLTTKPHGLGMGLPVSRSIIEFHGGRLSGENNSDGGMSFRIRLPLMRG